MLAPEMAENTPFMPNGMNPPPPGLKLPAWKWKNRMMMVRTGMATFHHVMALLTRANSRTARKLIAVKHGHQDDRPEEAPARGDAAWSGCTAPGQ